MASTQSPDEQRDAKLAELTNDRAFMILAALKAGAEQNTKLMIQDVSEFLADDQALGQLIRDTANGGNAFHDLLQKLIWTEAERQAEQELVHIARHNREISIADRAHRYLDRLAAPV